MENDYRRLEGQVEWLCREARVEDAQLAVGIRAVWRGEPLDPSLEASDRRQAVARLALLLLARGPTLSSTLLVSTPLRLEAIERGEGMVVDVVRTVFTLETGAPHDPLAAELASLLAEAAPPVAELWRMQDPTLTERLNAARSRLAAEQALTDRVIEAVSARAAAALADQQPLNSAPAYLARARRRIPGASLVPGRTKHDPATLGAAIADADAALALAPDDIEGLVLRARLRVIGAGVDGQGRAEDAQQAQQDVARALALAPDFPEAWVAQGEVAMTFLRNPVEAIAAYSRALSGEVPYLPAYALRGVLRIEIQDLDGAAEDAAQAVQLAPDSPTGHWIRARVCELRGEVEAALLAYEAALRADPNHAGSYQSRGNLRRALGDLPGARADADQAIQLSDDGSSYYNRGNLRMQEGDPAGAEQDFSEALSRNPQDFQAALNRGTTRLMASDSAGGRADFELAARLAPHYPAARMKLGVLLLHLQEPAAALSELHAALACAPADWPHRAEIAALVASFESPIIN